MHVEARERIAIEPAVGIGSIALLAVVTILVAVVGHNPAMSLNFAVGDHSSGDGLAYYMEALSEGSLRRQVGIIMLGLIGGVSILRNAGTRLRFDPVLATVAGLFLLWASLSLLWADDFSLAFRRLIVFWLLTIAAVGVVAAVPRETLPWFVALSGIAYIIFGVGSELFYGTFTPLRSGYRFSGSLHPNAQGINCALVALAGIWAATRPGRKRMGLALLVAGIGLVFLFMTRSRTSFAAFIGASSVLLTLQFRPGRRLVIATIGINVALLVGLMYINGFLAEPPGVLMMGRDTETLSTLSSRVPLWRWLFDFIAARPWTGYGYSAFMTQQRAEEISLLLQFGIAGAHSLYLEVMLGVGIVGLVLLVAMFVLSFARGVRKPASPFVNREATLFAAVMVFEVLNGMLDSSLVFPSWRLPTLMIFVALALRVGPSPSPARRPVRNRF